MDRNLEQELDELKSEIKALKDLIEGQGNGSILSPDKEEAEKLPPFVGHVAKMSYSAHRTTENPNCLNLLSQLEDRTGNTCSTGGVAYMGLFTSAGRQSTWVREYVDTDGLLKLMESGKAGEVLKSVGSGERLQLLLSLLKKPSTAAELLSACGFGTTGQVYHHLKPLVSADLVEEESGTRGVYAVKPHRVQGIIMLLCGIMDLIDGTYSTGNFE